MKSKIFVLSVFFLATLNAITVSFQEGDGGSFSTMYGADIKTGTPDTWYGDTGSLVTDNPRETASQMFLLSFPQIIGAMSGQIPIGSLIQSAVLSIRTSSNASPSTQTIHRVLNSWNESNVTYNSFKGGYSSLIQDVHYTSTIYGSYVPVNTETTYSVDITSLVQLWTNGTANYGIIVFDSSSDGYTAHSDDVSNISYRPQLTIQYTPVPEMSSWILIAMAGLGIVLKKNLR